MFTCRDWNGTKFFWIKAPHFLLQIDVQQLTTTFHSNFNYGENMRWTLSAHQRFHNSSRRYRIENERIENPLFLTFILFIIFITPFSLRFSSEFSILVSADKSMKDYIVAGGAEKLPLNYRNISLLISWTFSRSAQVPSWKIHRTNSSFPHMIFFSSSSYRLSKVIKK